MVEALITAALGSGYTQIISFTLVIVMLAVLPNGLFGRADGEGLMKPALRDALGAGGADRPASGCGPELSPPSTATSCFRAGQCGAAGAGRHRPERAAGLDRPDVVRPRGFYAIGAYTVAILTGQAGMELLGGLGRRARCWRASPAARLPALLARERPVSGDDHHRFRFIVEHALIEGGSVTGGSNT